MNTVRRTYVSVVIVNKTFFSRFVDGEIKWRNEEWGNGERAVAAVMRVFAEAIHCSVGLLTLSLVYSNRLIIRCD